MKALITLVIIVGLYLVGKSIMEQYEAKQRKERAPETPAVLDGLPPQLESSLADAQAKGATALRDWLQKYGQHARDPRLAEIQLDYVVLLSRSNPGEAKSLFRAIKQRTPKDSPVFERIKRLDSTYGN